MPVTAGMQNEAAEDSAKESERNHVSTAYVTEYIKLSLFICKAMTSLAKVYITLAGLDYAPIEVIGKGLTDSSVLGPQLWAA